MSEPRVAIIVPRRPDHGWRDDLWAFCRARWEKHFPDWPIIEACDEGGPTFNRGQAINAGIKGIAWGWLDGETLLPDVYLIIDADVAIEPAQVAHAAQVAYDTGRACFPFTRYFGLDQPMTDRVLNGYEGDWTRCRAVKMGTHCSSVMAVPAALWDETGGFDERLKSWGQDDLIFTHACRVLGGGIARIGGAVYHLWHPHTPERKPDHPGIRANNAIARRFFAAQTPAEVSRLIAERQAQFATVVISNGRRDAISRAIPSFERRSLVGSHPLVICDDSGDPEFTAYLRLNFPRAEIVHPKRGTTGYAANTLRAQEAALELGAEWIVHLEEDFVLQREVDFQAIAGVLRSHPELTQMVLLRQPWFPKEIEGGSLYAPDRGAYVERYDDRDRWVEHSLGFWTNPHLVHRDLIAAHPWPRGVDSERRFGKQVLVGGRRSAFWGGLNDPPLVEHVGERSGTGY